MRKTKPAPEGADHTAALEIEPSAAAHERSWAGPKIANAYDTEPTPWLVYGPSLPTGRAGLEHIFGR